MALDRNLPVLAFEWVVPDTHVPYLHRHDCLEVGYCRGGAGVFVVEGRVYPYTAGCVCVINPGQAHLASTVSEQGSPWVFTHLDTAMLLGSMGRAHAHLLRTERFWRPGFPNIISPQGAGAVGDLIRQLCEEAAAQGPHSGDVLRGLAWALLGYLHRMADGMVEGELRPVRPGTMTRIAPAVSFVSSHYSEPIGVDDLASVCGLSPSQLRRVFSSALGRSPQEYIDGYRLGMAATLLQNTDMTVLEVSEQVGFGSVSTLNRQFRQRMHASPASWRRRPK